MNLEINNKKITRLKIKGFTLVETLVAVSILSVSILAGFTAVQNSLKSSLTAKNQITAFYLVQDAMEYIKNKRDENALNFINGGSNNWLEGMSSGSDSPCWHGDQSTPQRSCVVDVNATPPYDIVNCTGTCQNIRMDPNTGLMGYDYSWNTTNFSRTIQFQNIVDDEEIRVVITISWTQGSVVKTFSVSEILFNRLQ